MSDRLRVYRSKSYSSPLERLHALASVFSEAESMFLCLPLHLVDDESVEKLERLYDELVTVFNSENIKSMEVVDIAEKRVAYFIRLLSQVIFLF